MSDDKYNGYNDPNQQDDLNLDDNYDGPAYSGDMASPDVTDDQATTDRSDDFYDQLDETSEGSYNRDDYDDMSDVLGDEDYSDYEEYDGGFEDQTAAETDTSVSSEKTGNQVLKFLGPVLFIVVLVVNYLSAMGGPGFPNTQAEITARHANLLAPAGFTFSIWGLIYLGVAATLLSRFIYSKDAEFIQEYKKLQPFNWVWMVLNIAWVFTFSYDQLGISTFIIVLYTLALAYQSYKVSNTPVLNKHKLMLKWPIGLHFGWLIAATFANLTVFLVQVGLNGTGAAGILWTLVAMILIVLAALYFFRTHENIAIFLPALWTLIGILVQQSPSSSFQYASTIVFIVSVIFFVAGVGLAAISIFQRYQHK